MIFRSCCICAALMFPQAKNRKLLTHIPRKDGAFCKDAYNSAALCKRRELHEDDRSCFCTSLVILTDALLQNSATFVVKGVRAPVKFALQ